MSLVVLMRALKVSIAITVSVIFFIIIATITVYLAVVVNPEITFEQIMRLNTIAVVSGTLVTLLVVIVFWTAKILKTPPTLEQ